MAQSIFIADDHPMIVEHLESSITNIAGVGTSWIDVINKIEASTAQTLVTDLNMPTPKSSTIEECIRAAHKKVPGLRVLLISADVPVFAIKKYFENGLIHAFLQKENAPSRTINNYLSVIQNGAVIPPEWLTTINTVELTPKEIDVISLLQTHPEISNSDLAEKLCISVATIKYHLANIYRKFNVNSKQNLLSKIKEDLLLQ